MSDRKGRSPIPINQDRVKDVAAKDASAVGEDPDELTKRGDQDAKVEKRKSRTAATRADELEKQLIGALKSELDRARSECDQYRGRCDKMAPELSGLQQASKNAKQNSTLGAFCAAFGSATLGVSQLEFPAYVTYAMNGAGAVLAAVGALLILSTHWLGWPNKGG